MRDLQIFEKVDDLINALANLIVDVAKKSIRQRGEFNFVLSGGGSPRKLYELLASTAFRDKIEWEHTYFFFGDERFVPEGDAERNSLMAKESLFDPLNIKNQNIFEVDTTGTPEESAQKYSDSIDAHFKSKAVEFDFILLGIGDNSHTASLFPHTSVLMEKEATVKSVFVEELDKYRITMTAPMINNAKNIAFLVFGKDKAEAVHHILEDSEGSAEEFPAKLIHSNNNNLVWFLDEEAAALIHKKF